MCIIGALDLPLSECLCPPQILYIEILMPSVMLLGCLGHEDGALMHGVNVIIKENLLPTPPPP